MSLGLLDIRDILESRGFYVTQENDESVQFEHYLGIAVTLTGYEIKVYGAVDDRVLELNSLRIQECSEDAICDLIAEAMQKYFEHNQKDLVRRFNTEASVLDALEEKFCFPEWALFRNVRNSTGSMHTREADAIAINMYPSRGQEIWGFEVKVSRGDLLKELKDPYKADVIASFCDCWYLVLGSKDLMKKEDPIPGPWGIMAPRGNKLVIVRKAGTLPITSEGFSSRQRGFVTALARRIWEMSPEGREDKRVREAKTFTWDAAIKHSSERYRRELRSQCERVESLEKVIRDFEKTTGVNIRYLRGDYSKFKRAMALFDTTGLRDRTNTVIDEIRGVIHRLQVAERDCLKYIKAWEKESEDTDDRHGGGSTGEEMTP